MPEQKRIWNPQALLESACCLTFAVILGYLVISGGYQQYVTPKMVPYFYFTIAVMVIWAMNGLFYRSRSRQKVRAAHCLTLAIPILLLLLPHAPVTYSSLSSGYLGGDSITGNPSSSSAQQIPGKKEPAYGSELSGLDEANKTITVTDSEFYLWITKLYESPDQYEGYQIKMTGSVFRDSSQMQQNEFVPARLMMTCCVSDLTPVGLLCQYDGTAQLKTDSWVTVEGTVFYADYEGIKEPRISVSSITPAQEVPGYLYPLY
ncbi:TIGR03943 family putative permease subunit [Clostridium minihomine]|uniref:TIGR03943 family putative permease subunit n=1 Tax=Clostridium minihomine TaxID=2045012 RepID=UPI000C77467A|nr:TIGR03943 family protein [Clostridium minihomine]